MEMAAMVAQAAQLKAAPEGWDQQVWIETILTLLLAELEATARYSPQPKALEVEAADQEAEDVILLEHLGLVARAVNVVLVEAEAEELETRH